MIFPDHIVRDWEERYGYQSLSWNVNEHPYPQPVIGHFVQQAWAPAGTAEVHVELCHREFRYGLQFHIPGSEDMATVAAILDQGMRAVIGMVAPPKVTDDGLPSELAVDHVVGWREWIVGEEYRLEPLGMRTHIRAGTGLEGTPWRGAQEVAAACLKGINVCRTPPGDGCHCGFNARYEPVRTNRVGKPPSGAPVTVLGLIACRGEVICMSDGFRAQYARPLALATPKDAHPDYKVAAALTAEANGLPTGTVDALKALASEWGSWVPENYRTVNDDVRCPYLSQVVRMPHDLEIVRRLG